MEGGTILYVVFVEYMIFYHRTQEYLAYMSKFKKKNPTMELLESADQEGLFVEIWREVNDEDFSIMKKERTEETYSSFTADLYEMIDHSKSRIRMWRFISTRF